MNSKCNFGAFISAIKIHNFQQKLSGQPGIFTKGDGRETKPITKISNNC